MDMDRNVLLLLLAIYVTHVSLFRVRLNKVSSIYLPYEQGESGETYKFEENIEHLAVDTEAQIIYTVGNKNMFIIDMSDEQHLQLLYNSKSINSYGFKDVELCGEFVIFLYEEGYIYIYSKFNQTTKKISLVNSLKVERYPEMILPTKTCEKIIVALEGLPNCNDDQLGGIGIFSFASSDLSNPPEYKRLHFTSFDNRYDELSKSGVRFVRQTLSSYDLEPTYLTFNEDETLVYVGIQLLIGLLLHRTYQHIAYFPHTDLGDFGIRLGDTEIFAYGREQYEYRVKRGRVWSLVELQ